MSLNQRSSQCLPKSNHNEGYDDGSGSMQFYYRAPARDVSSVTL